MPISFLKSSDKVGSVVSVRKPIKAQSQQKLRVIVTSNKNLRKDPLTTCDFNPSHKSEILKITHRVQNLIQSKLPSCENLDNSPVVSNFVGQTSSESRRKIRIVHTSLDKRQDQLSEGKRPVKKFKMTSPLKQNALAEPYLNLFGHYLAQPKDGYYYNNSTTFTKLQTSSSLRKERGVSSSTDSLIMKHKTEAQSQKPVPQSQLTSPSLPCPLPQPSPPHLSNSSPPVPQPHFNDKVQSKKFLYKQQSNPSLKQMFLLSHKTSPPPPPQQQQPTQNQPQPDPSPRPPKVYDNHYRLSPLFHLLRPK